MDSPFSPDAGAGRSSTPCASSLAARRVVVAAAPTGRPRRRGSLLTFGDSVVQLLRESNVQVAPDYHGEALELVRVPADAPLGEKHQLLAAGTLLPIWDWLDAVSVGSDVVIAFLEGGEGPSTCFARAPRGTLGARAPVQHLGERAVLQRAEERVAGQAGPISPGW